jgi:hypothetical protein
MIDIVNKNCWYFKPLVYPKPTATFASGGQNPFYKKGSGLPKIFHWEGLDTLFFFVYLCVSSWLKLDGGFRAAGGIDIFGKYDIYDLEGLIMTFGDKDFHFGVNIAWFLNSYGHDLAPNHIVSHYKKENWPLKFNYDTHLIDGIFRHLAHRGITVVRFWVFEQLEGINFTEPNITGIDEILLERVDDIMEKAKKHNLELYWCLLDGARAASMNMWDNILKNIIANRENMRETFIEKVLRPFLETIKKNKNHIFAIDLINEPEGTKLEWEYIKSYIEAAAETVHAEGFKCSVGFQKVKTVKKYKNHLKSHLDFYDYHIYNNNGKVEAYSRLGLDKPCIIGEFGYKARFPWSFFRRVKRLWLSREMIADNAQYKTGHNLMINAKAKGYKGCLIWRYSPCGDGHRILKVNKAAKSTDHAKSFNPDVNQAFKGSFLEAAGGSPGMSMDDNGWTEKHERKVWQAIKSFVKG